MASPSLAHARFLRAALLVGAASAAVAPCTAALAARSPPSRAAPAARADRAAVEAARRFLCPNGGSPARGGRCRGGRAGLALAEGRDLSVHDWDAGLPAAARRQAPCPEGTVQARPLFWNDAVRCLPR